MMQYFATNRSIEHLGRAAKPGDAGERHKLSRGGYYFVDMQKYMQHYLATTDPGEMPREAIVSDSESTVFDGFLSKPYVSAIVVCVHGYNVELFEAFTWFRILTDTMKNLPQFADRVATSPKDVEKHAQPADNSLSVFIGFSWPSKGSVLSYLSDQREAVGSATAFASLLARLRATGKTVHLVCHSMGNYLACHTFAALVNEQIAPPVYADNAIVAELLKREAKVDGTEHVQRNEWFVDNFVMIAPDVERRHVTKCASSNVETDYVGQFYSGLQHLVRRKINFYSRFDGALAISNVEKVPREAGLAIGDAASRLTFNLLDFLRRNPDQRWEKRLGEAPAPVNAAPGFISVNATELANRKIDHGDHADSRPIVAQIVRELEI